MSGRRARRCEVAKRAARVRLVVRLHTICPFVNVLVTYSLDYSVPPPEFALRFRQMRISDQGSARIECTSQRGPALRLGEHLLEHTSSLGEPSSRSASPPLRAPPQHRPSPRPAPSKDPYRESQLSRDLRLPLAVSLGQLGTIDMNVSTCIGWDSPWKPPRRLGGLVAAEAQCTLFLGHRLSFHSSPSLLQRRILGGVPSLSRKGGGGACPASYTTSLRATSPGGRCERFAPKSAHFPVENRSLRRVSTKLGYSEGRKAHSA